MIMIGVIERLVSKVNVFERRVVLPKDIKISLGQADKDCYALKS